MTDTLMRLPGSPVTLDCKGKFLMIIDDTTSSALYFSAFEARQIRNYIDWALPIIEKKDGTEGGGE